MEPGLGPQTAATPGNGTTQGDTAKAVRRAGMCYELWFPDPRTAPLQSSLSLRAHEDIQVALSEQR